MLNLIDVEELRNLRRGARDEFWIAIVCLLCVLVFGSLTAVAVAFLMSAIALMRHQSQARTSVMVRLPTGITHFRAVDETPTLTEPGLIIYRFGAPLYFANARRFTDEVIALVSAPQVPPAQWFILYVDAVTDVDSTGAESDRCIWRSSRRDGSDCATVRFFDGSFSLSGRPY